MAPMGKGTYGSQQGRPKKKKPSLLDKLADRTGQKPGSGKQKLLDMMKKNMKKRK